MTVPITVPSPGESVTKGTIARWLKPNGSLVRRDEPLFELESDKAALEVQAPVTGILTIEVPQGEVKIGATVGHIDERADVPLEDRGSRQDSERPASLDLQSSKPLSPAARQMAADHKIDPSQLTGTGRGGRVMKEDVQRFLAEARTPPPPPAPVPPPVAPVAAQPVPTPAGNERVTRQKMTTIRQRIAERLVVAQQTAAILTTFNEADLSQVMALRTKYKDSFARKHGVGLGFMSFFVKAAVEALRAFPAVNARIDGTDIVYHHYCNIGVAVSTERGLMVPVLRDAEKLGFAQIEKGIAELAEKARAGKITVADLEGGTFTITNGGVFGSMLSTPILNPPQSAILGMHAIQKRPVAVDDQVVIRPMMYLALSYDHRLIDGREAVRFLVRIKECIEAPERLLLEI
jgi:2-oxoglutarate dehydrogenase E2 component (dihydrolipoamide succinyltransferase)